MPPGRLAFMSAFTPGMRLHDRFTLEERIGMGGMSEVWRAVDGVLGRPVAVKVLGSALAADPVLWQATLREARAVAQISHPNVAQVHDYGEIALPTGGHVPYLVMELVRGQDLAARLRLGPIAWPQAATIAAQVASGLAAAHRLGVVHRDIKPGNVMLTTAGVKILDFGIAALAFGPDADGGRLIGTPTYTAPERMRPGAPAPAGDVYSLGVLLYEMLTGRPPWSFQDWQQALATHRAGSGVPPIETPGVPPRLIALTMACLSADPARRPTAAEVSATASELQSGATAPMPAAPAAFAAGTARPPAARPPAAQRTMIAAAELDGPERPGRSRLLPAFLITGGAIAVLLVVMLVYSLSSPDRGTGTATSPPTGVATSAQTAESPTPPPSPSASARAPKEILAEFEQLLATSAAPPSRTRDLRRKVKDLADALDENPDKAKDRLDGVRQKLEDMIEAGQLETGLGQQLTTLLDELEAAL